MRLWAARPTPPSQVPSAHSQAAVRHCEPDQDGLLRLATIWPRAGLLPRKPSTSCSAVALALRFADFSRRSGGGSGAETLAQGRRRCGASAGFAGRRPHPPGCGPLTRAGAPDTRRYKARRGTPLPPTPTTTAAASSTVRQPLPGRGGPDVGGGAAPPPPPRHRAEPLPPRRSPPAVLGGRAAVKTGSAPMRAGIGIDVRIHGFLLQKAGDAAASPATLRTGALGSPSLDATRRPGGNITPTETLASRK